MLSPSSLSSPVVPMRAPNLEELLGTTLSHALIRAAGGLVGLSKMADGALRHIGVDRGGATGRANQLHCGYLADAPVFVRYFGDDEVNATDLASARKALSQLSKKCVLAVKTDVSGSDVEGSFGAGEREKLEAAFARLRAEGKVSVVDTQALPVPEVHKRGEAPKKKRGGIKEFKRRVTQAEAPTVVERAFSRVKMGISEEKQREERLQSNELRVAFGKEQQRMIEREVRRRGREDTGCDEYDDLMNIAL